MSEKKLDQIIELLTDARVDIASMKTDLRHHIKRSDQHEVELKAQDKKIGKMWIAIAALAGAGTSSAAPAIFTTLMKLMGA